MKIKPAALKCVFYVKCLNRDCEAKDVTNRTEQPAWTDSVCSLVRINSSFSRYISVKILLYHDNKSTFRTGKYSMPKSVG